MNICSNFELVFCNTINLERLVDVKCVVVIGCSNVEW